MMQAELASKPEKPKGFTNPRFPRFLVVGVLCFGVNLGILHIGTGLLGTHYLVSLGVSMLVSNGLGFTLNRCWTFEARQGHFWRQLTRYYAANCSSFALNTALMVFLVSVSKFNYLWASASLAVAFTLLNFVLHKSWSFRQER